MKTIVLTFILLAQSAYGATLSKIYSSPEGTSEQAFKIEKKTASYQKRSNFFDTQKNLTLGSYELSAKATIDLQKKLETILDKVKNADAFMKKKGLSFNAFSAKTPHEPFFLLNDFYISNKSDLYPELELIFKTLQNKNWKLKQGMELASDYKTISFLRNGKVERSEKYDFAFHCQKKTAPTHCMHKDFGILYVQ